MRIDKRIQKQKEARRKNRERVSNAQLANKSKKGIVSQLLGKESCKRSDIFENSGVYMLLKKNKVVYVGESANVLKRIMQHASKDWDSYIYLERIGATQRKNLEASLILKYEPIYNIKGNPIYS